MKSLEEVSKIVGLSRRAIQEYEKAGVVPKPTHRTKRGYLRYDNQDIFRLFQVRFYRELGYDSKDIREIFAAPNFNRKNAITSQIAEMRKKKERLEDLITIAETLQDTDLNPETLSCAFPECDQLPFDMFISFFSGGIRVAESTENDEELDDTLIEDGFEQAHRILELIQCGYLPESDVVQSKIEMIYRAFAQSTNPSIYIFWGICQMFAPGTELGSILDDLYGANSAKILYQAAELFSKTKIHINGNHKLIQALNQINALRGDGNAADSQIVQHYIDILLEGLYEETGMNANQWQKISCIWKRQAFQTWDAPEKEPFVFLAQAIEAYYKEKRGSK